MRVGDLVVRMWLGKPKWDMIGLVIFRQEHGPLSETRWSYGIKWNTPSSLYRGERQFGKWTKKEVGVISERR